MAFKENVKSFGSRVKEFWKEHWVGIVTATSGIAIVGAVCYASYKTEQNHAQQLLQDAMAEAEKETEEYLNMIEEKTAWNKEWDELGLNFENLTHQPFGDLTVDIDDYVDPFDGNCFIIAGPNSLYNESPDKMEFYMLDKEGWYHHMPDDVRSA